MIEHTLLTKIYSSHQLKQIEQIVKDILGDLSVEVIVKPNAAVRWIQIEVSGEDEAVASKLLEREVGFCPVSSNNVKAFSDVRGYVTDIDESTEGLKLDIGVFQPKPTFALLPLQYLQTRLTSGKKTPLKDIVNLWGFCENLPLNIRILKIGEESNRVDSEFQALQMRRYFLWRDSLLDRLIVVGASLMEVNSAVAMEGLSRDVIDVESLGLFEHALVCKLGTDATGLIGRIGKRLRKAKFTVFNPKRLVPENWK